MSDSNISMKYAVLVEDELQFSLGELSHVCHAEIEQLITFVEEGVLTPMGDAPSQWRFAGTSLRRARAATRLAHDLELSAAGTALVLDLLDEIEILRSRLRRVGIL